jgi:exodeoxyribonuclease VII large subunit
MQRVDQGTHRAARAAAACVAAASGRVAATAAALRALAPAATLARGYNVATRDGAVVKRAAALAPGDEVRLHFADGGRGAVIGDD